METMLSKNSAVIFYGRSQVGKSSLINLIRTDNGPKLEVGDGSGQSVTKHPVCYPDTNIGYTVQEVPGIDDSDLEVDNDKAAMESALQLVRHVVKKVKFVVCDSLADSSVQVKALIANLIQVYGEKARDNMVVLGTKADRADDEELPGRTKKILQVMEEAGVGNRFVEWRNKSTDGRLVEKQMSGLCTALSQISGLQTEHLQKLNDLIETRARELHDGQETKYVTGEVEVEEQYLSEGKMEKEEHEVEVDREINAFIDELKTRRKTCITKTVLSFGGYAVIKASKTIMKKGKEKRYREKMVYEKKTQKVKKNIPVPLPKRPLEEFLPEAQKQVVEEFRGSV